MKSIVIFSDGTGNSARSPDKTNVFRLYQAIDTSPQLQQITYYDEGVGTSSNFILGLFGKVFGLGLADNVKDIYRFVCRKYQDGDKIYGFGFSRGAFTMRVVMALISDQGLINPKDLDDRQFQKEINQAYIAFRKKGFKRSVFSFIPKLIHYFMGDDDVNHNKRSFPNITMLGVWDTVDAYGMPIDEMRSAWDLVIYPLAARDRNCAAKVEHAYHALALDEQRLSFAPILWNEQNDADTKVTQVWFSGLHADVGGGYADRSLAMVSLNWMIENATRHGLRFDSRRAAKYSAESDTSGPMHDSRSSWGFIYRFEPRQLEAICRDNLQTFLQQLSERLTGGLPNESRSNNEVYIQTPLIHQSVLHRLDDYTCNYAPINLPERYRVVDDQNRVLAAHGESTPEAARRNQQGGLWNLVLSRKVIYGANVILVVTLLISLSSYMNGSIQFYSSLFTGGLIAGLLLLGGKLKRWLQESMGSLWQRYRDDNISQNTAPPIVGVPLYDDRIVEDKLKRAPASKFIIVIRNLTELACVALYLSPLFFLIRKLFAT